MKIVKIGTFDNRGMPIGWSIDVGGKGVGFQEGTSALGVSDDAYVLGIDILGVGIVDVNGIEIVEWTDARRTVTGVV